MKRILISPHVLHREAFDLGPPSDVYKLMHGACIFLSSGL